MAEFRRRLFLQIRLLNAQKKRPELERHISRKCNRVAKQSTRFLMS